MENKLSHTQCMALAHMHRKMMDFLGNYAEKKLQPEFFINGMTGLIDEIDCFVRENGAYSCSYPRQWRIHKDFEEKYKID